MPVIEEAIIKTDIERLISEGTETPGIIDNSITSAKSPISGVLALGMLGIAVIIIVLGLWAQKHKRKPMLMQCRTDVKSYQSMCSMPAILPLPQFMTQIKSDSKNRLTKKTDKNFPLVHDKGKILQQKSCGHYKRNHKILNVSELWKQKSKQSNNFFVINVIPEEDWD